jgi:stage II sporulation protein D
VRSASLLVVALATACTLAPPAKPGGALRGEGRVVRVALHLGVQRATLGATGAWRIVDARGESTLLLGGDSWILERDGSLVRFVGADGVAMPPRPAPVMARPEGVRSLLLVDGKRYRGDLVVAVRDTGLVVVNRLPVEWYLRGVVPLEIGRRAPGERAAVEAQAVAARSFAYSRLRDTLAGLYDLRASTLDQAYGGVDAELPLTDQAVSSTRGMVLTYGGRVVGAPYSSSCGGRTAAASEVWRSPDEPYLASVSDTIPGTTRAYCDIAPIGAWIRAYDRAELDRVLARYLAAYAAVPSAGPGSVRRVEVDGRTPSGRVRGVVVSTAGGRYALRGNDVRFVLRSPSGEILPSTYFSLDAVDGPDGRLSRLVLHGRGNGHGVGMCQWGAIGRARAGQDFRAILQTYYPGTSVDAL